MTNQTIKSAKHWEALADTEEAMAAWNRERGLDLSAPGQSVGDHKATMFRRVAGALRLEDQTSVAHCHCHQMPQNRCPSGQAH